MSAFSRGCFFRHQCAFRAGAFKPPRTSSQARFFSSSPFHRAANGPKRVVPKGKPSNVPANATSNFPPPVRVYQSFAETLAQKLHSTPLYEAPSHTMFMVTSYGAAALFIVYGGYAFYTYYEPRDNVAYWVRYAFVVGGFLMGGFAGYFVLGPSMLIKSITAIPKNVVRSLGTEAKGGSIPELQLEVELKKMLPVPFFPARKIYIRPQEMVLPMPLGPTASQRLTPAEMRQMKVEEERRRQMELEYERNHIMTSPFRHMNKVFFSLFQNTRRAFMKEGFVTVQVKQRTYKLDITGGWALDNGKALDRLVGVKK